MQLHGKPHLSSAFRHENIMRGGVLEFEMTDKEPASAGPVKKNLLKDIYIDRGPEPVKFVAVPQIDGGSRVFTGKTTVSLSSNTPGAIIHYTADGTEPDPRSPRYQKPFILDRTSVVRAVAIDRGGYKSLTAEARFFKKPNDWSVKIANKYNRQYTGGGDEGLIDGIRGTLNWASGEWQGYQPYDLDAVIDLKRETEIKRVGGGFLQDARSWIWMPTHIEFEVSSDGVNFEKVADIKTDVDPKDMTAVIRDYKQNITPVRARYVRVRAYNLGKIPQWHPGAGDDAFIFVDEIFIE